MKYTILLVIIYCAFSIPANNVHQDFSRPDLGVPNLDLIPLTPKANHLDRSAMQNAPHYKNLKSIQQLGNTPKAMFLSNHFGTDKAANVQGPTGSGVNQNALPQGYATSTGQQYNPADQTEVSRNFPLNEPDVDPLKNSPNLRKMVDASSGSCILQLQPYQSVCATLAGCEACVASRNCGFERKSGACLPGSPSSPACPIFGAAWTFGGGCPNGPTSGHMTNVAPEHQGNVRPEQRTRLGAQGPWWKEVDPAGQVRVVSGDFSNLAAEASSLITPKQRSAANDTEVPDTWDPNVPDGKHVISGSVSNLAPGAKDLVTPGVPNVYNHSGLTAPDQNNIMTTVFLQQKGKAKLRNPSEDEIRNAEQQDEHKMEGFIQDMVENMPKSNGDADSLDEIKGKFDYFSESLNKMKQSLHLDDDQLKGKLEHNDQFKTMLKDNNIKTNDQSVTDFKEKMDKDLKEEDKMEKDERKEMEQEEKDYGKAQDITEESPEKAQEEMQRFEDAVEDGSLPDKEGSFKLNNEEAQKISKEMEEEKTKLDKADSNMDKTEANLDQESQKLTEQMNKPSMSLKDKNVEVDELQKLTAEADAQIEKEDKLAFKGKKDDEDLNTMADDLDNTAKNLDDVGVENMNIRFKQAQQRKAQEIKSTLEKDDLLESPADDLIKQREKSFDNDETDTTSIANKETNVPHIRNSVKAITMNKKEISRK